MTFTVALLWMQRLAGIAASVNGVELLLLSRAESRSLSSDGIWRPDALSREWGIFRPLLAERGFTLVLLLQVGAALWLALAGGAPAAGVLCITTVLSAMRFRGNVNGGSDAMLFTVLGGLLIAQWPQASARVHEGALLYVAAQLTLSYLRAGVVKARQRSWWTGDALTAFLALPAYGVPDWALKRRVFLRAAGVAVVLFECAAPVAWSGSTAALAFALVAISFHAATTQLFGLNRFLLAWGAAMPALLFAAQRMSGGASS